MNFLSWITCCSSESVESEDQREKYEEPTIIVESPRMKVKNKPAKEEHKEVRGEGTIRFCRPPEGTYGKLRIKKKVIHSPAKLV